MIELTRLNGQALVVNAELIETVEAMPDTVVTLTTARKLVVREPVAEVVARVIAYRRQVCALPRAAAGTSAGGGGDEG